MSRVQRLRLFVSQRLNEAVEEILGAYEKTIAKYEQEAALSQQVISRQHALLCALNKPLMDRPSADAITQQLLVPNNGVFPQNQDQVQEGEQLQDLDETEIIQFTYNARCAARPGSAEPAVAGPDQDVHLVSSETEDSEDYSKDFTDTRSPPKQPKPKRAPKARRQLSCRVCRQIFRARKFLMRHVKTHLQETEPTCGICGKHFEAAESLKLHLQSHQPGTQSREGRRRQHSEADMKAHTSLKEHACDDCGETFLQERPKRRRQCRLRKNKRNRRDENLTDSLISSLK